MHHTKVHDYINIQDNKQRDSRQATSEVSFPARNNEQRCLDYDLSQLIKHVYRTYEKQVSVIRVGYLDENNTCQANNEFPCLTRTHNKEVGRSDTCTMKKSGNIETRKECVCSTKERSI